MRLAHSHSSLEEASGPGDDVNLLRRSADDNNISETAMCHPTRHSRHSSNPSCAVHATTNMFAVSYLSKPEPAFRLCACIAHSIARDGGLSSALAKALRKKDLRSCDAMCSKSCGRGLQGRAYFRCPQWHEWLNEKAERLALRWVLQEGYTAWLVP
jgi:hypothetical protein